MSDKLERHTNCNYLNLIIPYKNTMSGPQITSYFSKGAKYYLKSCVDRYTSPGERLPEENIQITTSTTGSASDTWQFYPALDLGAW